MRMAKSAVENSEADSIESLFAAFMAEGNVALDKTPEIALSDENTADRTEAKKAWTEIEEWCLAAMVQKNLSRSRFGFLGGNYSGMLDMYSDLTMLSALMKSWKL